MNNDKPINNHTQDALSRERFIEASVHQIENMDDDSSFIVGLYGKWGIGKTSIVNLIREKLKAEDYFTAYFNPWIFRTEEALLIEIFNTIIRGCNSDEKLKSTLSVIGSTLKKYADFIKLPKFNFYGAEIDITDTVQGVGKALGTFLDEDLSLEKQKGITNQVLRQLEKPLVIFIDDVDRLDRVEIRLLFKTIKLTADFDKIIYVLAFDEEVVSKSLGQFYGSGEQEDGKRFIEKIVQLPIRIPKLSTETKLKYSLTLISKWENKNKLALPNIDKEDFIDKFEIVHDLFLETPRDSKRLMNAFSFVEKSLRGEVNPFDLILIESLRLFTPKLFQLLVNSNEWLFNSFGNKDINISSRIDVTEVPSEKQSGVLSIVDWLFPNHKLVFTDEPKSIDSIPLDYWDTNKELEKRIKNLTKNLNIGSRPYFLKYLEFNIGPDQIPDTLFKGILDVFNKKSFQELEDELNNMSSFSADILFNKFEIFESELNELGRINFIKLLFLNKQFNDSFALSKRLTGSPRSAFRIINKSISYFRESSDVVLIEEGFIEIVQESNHLQALAQLVKALELGFEIREEGRISLITIPSLDVEKIKTSFKERVSQTPVEDYFTDPDNYKNWDLFRLINEEGMLLPLKERIQRWINEDSKNALTLIKSFASMVFIEAKSYYNNQINDDAFIEAEKYADRNLLVNSILEIYDDIDLSFDPADDYGNFYKRDSDESVTIQYLRFVEREKNNK